MSLIPLDRRIGQPVAIITSSNGRLLTSPEPIFHIVIPTRVSISTASRENGELRKIRSWSRA